MTSMMTKKKHWLHMDKGVMTSYFDFAGVF